MIKSRNLDDQTYEQITQSAISRIPHIFPEWTDFNPHDPGITLIELLAWYKEMQQYHMNVVTDSLREKLLALAGVRLRPVQPARCLIKMPSAEKWHFPVLTRLETPEGIPFELDEEAVNEAFAVRKVYLQSQNSIRDMSEVVMQSKVDLSVKLTYKDSRLLIGFEGEPPKQLRLWFGIDDTGRNPFADGQTPPREVKYDFCCAGSIDPLYDETHALSQSGFVTFAVPNGWRASQCDSCDIPEMHYICIEIKRPGCEENIRINHIVSGLFSAVQKETLAYCTSLSVPSSAGTCAVLSDAVSKTGNVLVFLLEHDGYVQTSDITVHEEGISTVVTLDTSSADKCADNMLVISLDPVAAPSLFFDSNGLPGQRIPLALDGTAVMTDSFQILCDTLCGDGSTRPSLWQYTEDLSACGKRDRVFSFDSAENEIVFGDGEHGAIVPRGENAMVIASLSLTLASGGNTPAGKQLSFPHTQGPAVFNTEARGGLERQTVASAAEELSAMLNMPCRCVTEKDYEALALKSPGVRIKTAKAIAMYDPNAPIATMSDPVVTVVVIPASDDPLPMPDEWFIDAVRTHLERRRTIGTRIKVIPPEYAGINISAEVLTRDPDIEDRIREMLTAKFGINRNAIGGKISRGDIETAIGSLPGVLRVGSASLNAVSAGSYTEANGDIAIKPHAVPYLARLYVTKL